MHYISTLSGPFIRKSLNGKENLLVKDFKFVLFIFQTKRSVDESYELTKGMNGVGGRKETKIEYHVSDHNKLLCFTENYEWQTVCAPFEEVIFHFKNVGLHIF